MNIDFGTNSVTDWLSLLISGGLLVGALLAWRSLRAQIRLTEKVRQDSLLPVLTIQMAEYTSGVMRVWVQNVGSGPARKTRIIAWVFGFPREMLESSDLPDRVMGLAQTIDPQRPAFELPLAAVSAGNEPVEFDMLATQDFARTDFDPYGHGVLLYRAFCEDVFGNAFPGPDDEATVSWVAVNPGGHRELQRTLSQRGHLAVHAVRFESVCNGWFTLTNVGSGPVIAWEVRVTLGDGRVQTMNGSVIFPGDHEVVSYNFESGLGPEETASSAIVKYQDLAVSRTIEVESFSWVNAEDVKS